MKSKIYLLTTLTLVSCINLLGQTYNKQNTYLDALELARIRNSTPKGNKDTIYIISSLTDAFRKIVYKYGDDSELLDNPFLKDHLLGIRAPDKSYIGFSIFGEGNQKDKSIYKSIGYSPRELVPHNLYSANWQASAINGVANFMAGRFKQEISQIAIDQIFKQIKTEKDSTIIKALFPRTFNHIGNLYGSGLYYTADLQLLRQTAQMDIELLPKNIIKNPETIFSSFLLKKEPQIKDILLLGQHIVEYSRQGQPLDHLLSSLAHETYSSGSTIYKILNVADLISQALLNDEESKDTWVNPVNTFPTSLNSFKNIETRYFYGLLYQQLIQIPEFKTYLKSQNPNDFVLIATRIQGLVRFVNKLNITYNYIKNKEFNLKSPEEIVTYIKGINESLYSFNTALKNISGMHLNDSIIDISAKYISITETLMKQDYQKVIPLLMVEFGEYMDKNARSSRAIVFVSQLATIESADDMEALLSSYALPIGSSSIKRHSRFNISVNGYVGLTGGWETAYGTQKNQTKANIGLSAPVGISATFCNGYLTPFISFIDLGSIVNQRLNNDTTSYTNLRLEHFFTPGIGMIVNCPKLPISAGLHFNYVPNLRTIKYESGNTTITESNRSVTRINFCAFIDIPFFILHNKEKIR